MRIIFFIESKKRSSATNFRILQIIPHLKKIGIKTLLIQGYPGKNVFFTSSNIFLSLIINAILILIKSITIIFQLPLIIWADIIVIQRELVAYNLVYPEKIIFKLKKPVIFDFDDAIFLPIGDPSHLFSRNLFFQNLVKKTLKIHHMIKMADEVTVGNKYLAEFAKKFSNHVSIIPTVIDTNRYYPLKKKKKNKIVYIGWMGTSGNLKYFKSILSTLKKVSQSHPNTQLIICSDKFLLKDDLNSVIPTKFIQWESKNELKTLHKFDIGIMPIEDNEWTRGKCGFKLIQYMASGVPAIGSDVGMNKEIINDGINGLLAKNESEWTRKLNLLINDEALRKEVRISARNKIEQNYSINSVLSKLLSIFNRVQDRKVI